MVQIRPGLGCHPENVADITGGGKVKALVGITWRLMGGGAAASTVLGESKARPERVEQVTEA